MANTGTAKEIAQNAPLTVVNVRMVMVHVPNATKASM